MKHNSEIAAALGKPLWRTDSFVPRYRCGENGSWKLNPGGQLVHDWGYFTGPCLVEMLPSLSRKAKSRNGGDGDTWETWMSLTPHEIESQELGYRCAFGEMVIMGLGMGWIAANAALNHQVSKVTVVERDSDVIRLFSESGALDSLDASAQEKIDIVNADALTWCPAPDQSVDFLYADIWLHLAEPEAIGQVRRMQNNVEARTIYFWGQEIAIYSASSCVSNNEGEISPEVIRLAVSEVINLPLLIPTDRNYAKMIQDVIKNRTERHLPIEIELG